MLDALRTGLGGAVGAGLLFGIGPGAAAAGWWLLAGAVIAMLAALCTAASAAELGARNHGSNGLGVLRIQLGVLPARIAAVSMTGGRVLAAAVVAIVAGRYLTPTAPLAGALVVLVVGAVTALLGRRLPQRTLVAVAGPVVLLVLAIVAIACFAIAPVGTATPAGVAGADDWTGILDAAGFAVFAFLGAERAASVRRGPAVPLVAVPLLMVLLLGIYLAVAGGALHQLGGARLALSGAPLRDALVAADGAGIGQLLAVGAAIAAVVVLNGLFRELNAMVEELVVGQELPDRLRTAAGPVGLTVLGAVVVLTAVLVRWPGWLAPSMAVAGSLCVLGWAFTNSAARLVPDARRFWPKRAPCFGLGFSVLVSVVTALDHPIPVVAVLVFGTALLTGSAGLTAWRGRISAAPR
ncbi:hypothetical protein [Labedaea rhizosphaerae]|uniref:hypothetical protein n=1 Tax=Labedaea rhizosphaerae TaxID=598644 RepID=UPI00105E9E56|nr:hypothetical protein [Labedaea rhizosphaerae]